MTNSFYLKDALLIGVLECLHGNIGISSELKKLLNNYNDIIIFFKAEDFKNFILTKSDTKLI